MEGQNLERRFMETQDLNNGNFKFKINFQNNENTSGLPKNETVIPEMEHNPAKKSSTSINAKMRDQHDYSQTHYGLQHVQMNDFQINLNSQIDSQFNFASTPFDRYLNEGS